MKHKEILKDKEKVKILSRVFAHLMGDGCVTKRYLAYTNKNETLLKNFEEDIISLFGEVHIIKGVYCSGTSLVQVQNKEILTFLRGLVHDFRSFSLRIPDFIKTKDVLRGFLKSIYDDEGSVSLRVFKKTNDIKRNLNLSSNSKIFLEEIKEILINKFKIKTNVLGKYVKQKDGKEYVNYTLSITGKENFERFRRYIGFSHPGKNKRLELMIDSYIKK